MNILAEIIKLPIKIVLSGAAIATATMDVLCGEDTDVCKKIDDVWKA